MNTREGKTMVVGDKRSYDIPKKTTGKIYGFSEEE